MISVKNTGVCVCVCRTNRRSFSWLEKMKEMGEGVSRSGERVWNKMKENGGESVTTISLLA